MKAGVEKSSVKTLVKISKKGVEAIMGACDTCFTLSAKLKRRLS